MKALSSAAAAIFLATISISLVGTTYFFSSTVTEKAMAETFEVIDVYNNRLIVRNTGTQAIEKFKILVDGNEVDNTIEGDSISPKTVGTVVISLDEITEGSHELIVISESMSQTLRWEVEIIEETTTTIIIEEGTLTTSIIPSVEIAPGVETYTEMEQGKAEIGKPVKWTGNVVLNTPSDIEDYTLDLTVPEDAEEIIIKDSKKRVLFKDKTSWRVNVPANTNVSYSFEFETPEPYKEESMIKQFIPGTNYRKRITVKSDFIGHYEDVKAYTDIPEEASEGFRIRLYHTKSKSRADITDFPQYKVSLLDLNHNGIIDRIEWIVPVLSEQTFEVGAGIDKWAYEGPGANDNPPSGLSGTEFTSYTEIASSNDVRYTTTGGGARNNPFHRFEFTIPESVSSINKLDFYWEGYGDAGRSSLYVWNFNSGTWELLGSHSNTTIDGIVNASKTTDFTSYINASGFLELVAVDVRNKPTFISTDYVYVNVTSDDECLISIGLSEDLRNGIVYPSVGPIDHNVSAVNNTNSTGDTNYFIVISSSTCNIDIWMKANDHLKDNFGHVMAIGNSTFDDGSLSGNETSCVQCPNITQAKQMSLSYQNIGQNLPQGTTIYLRYWTCPYYCPSGPSVPPNPYNTTISVIGREAGSGPP